MSSWSSRRGAVEFRPGALPPFFLREAGSQGGDAGPAPDGAPRREVPGAGLLPERTQERDRGKGLTLPVEPLGGRRKAAAGSHRLLRSKG